MPFRRLAVLAALPASAHTPADPPHQRYEIGDFKLESGETIRWAASARWSCRSCS